MKNIDEILKCKKISDIAFHLDYYEMIEEMFKNKNSPPSNLFEEKELLEKRFKELCSQSKNDNNSICIVKLKTIKRL